MTTHDQQIAVDPATNVEPEFSSTRTEVPVSQSEPPAQTEPAQAEPAQAEPASTEPAQTEAASQSAEVQPSDHEMLFAGDLSGLRSRWDDIQAAFVDDPSGCVQQADGLVEEVIEQLTSRFADARSRLEAQWARGEQASTEDLRLALTRYREFFQRLLAV